jgi:hypothetical protein
MDRSAILTFSDQLREARGNALRDSEAFDEIIHVVERLGSFLSRRIVHLAHYKKEIGKQASHSPLAEEIPREWRGVHIPFALLYDLMTDARNLPTRVVLFLSSYTPLFLIMAVKYTSYRPEVC